MSSKWLTLFALVLTPTSAVIGCGGDDEGEGDSVNRPEQTGAACEVADDCFPKVEDRSQLSGIMCLDRVRDGYCTHECAEDTDCCAIEGECDTDLRQVCSPFESTGMNMCFLSCEAEDIVAPDDGGVPADDQEYCQRAAGRDFICRSSGGGSENRKVCVPGDCGVGAACTSNDDCDPDLECLTDVRGGYCGTRDCTADSECPENTRCVTHANGNNYCLRTCATNSDCSFCRGPALAIDCVDDANLVDPTVPAMVCVPDAR